jgi:hypothetical protein
MGSARRADGYCNLGAPGAPPRGVHVRCGYAAEAASHARYVGTAELGMLATARGGGRGLGGGRGPLARLTEHLRLQRPAAVAGRGASRSGAADLRELAAELATISAADVVEAQGKRGAVDPAIAPLWRPIALCGPACAAGARSLAHISAHPPRAGLVLPSCRTSIKLVAAHTDRLPY